MSNDLPSGWVEIPLSQCVEILDYKRVPVNNRDRERLIQDRPIEELVPYYGATGQAGYIYGHIFDEDLVLLGEDGVPFYDPLKHKAYLISGKSWVNNHAHVLRGLKGVSDNYYICHYLNQFNYQGFITGSTRLKLNQGSMKNIPVKLAPYEEQKRISAKLKLLLSVLDATKCRLDKVPNIIKRFRQSVLSAAVSGDLTKDWRTTGTLSYTPTDLLIDKKLIPNSYDLPSEWKWDTVENQIHGIESGKNIKCEERTPGENEFGIVKISAVTWGYFNEDESKTLSSEDLFWEHRRILEGDLLISRANTLELLGAPVIVEKVTKNLMLSDKVLRLLSADGYKEWLNICLRSPLGRFQIEQLATGNQLSMRNISQKNLKRVHVPTPSQKEIIEIVKRVNSLLGLADDLEARLSKSIKIVSKLSTSILMKAFKGELVEQDPGDEDASILLERIKMEHQLAMKKKEIKKKKTVKKRAKKTIEDRFDLEKLIVDEFQGKHFSFEELRKKVPLEYEELKDEVYRLLQDASAFLDGKKMEIFFDESSTEMKFQVR